MSDAGEREASCSQGKVEALGVAHVRLVPEERLPEIAGCKPGFIGPIGLNAPKGQAEVPELVALSIVKAGKAWKSAARSATL